MMIQFRLKTILELMFEFSLYSIFLIFIKMGNRIRSSFCMKSLFNLTSFLAAPARSQSNSPPSTSLFSFLVLPLPYLASAGLSFFGFLISSSNSFSPLQLLLNAIQVSPSFAFVAQEFLNFAPPLFES